MPNFGSKRMKRHPNSSFRFRIFQNVRTLDIDASPHNPCENANQSVARIIILKRKKKEKKHQDIQLVYFVAKKSDYLLQLFIFSN